MHYETYNNQNKQSNNKWCDSCGKNDASVILSEHPVLENVKVRMCSSCYDELYMECLK